MRRRVRWNGAPLEPLSTSVATDMAWIRTTPLEGDEDTLARAREMQRALYPLMYGERGPADCCTDVVSRKDGARRYYIL